MLNGEIALLYTIIIVSWNTSDYLEKCLHSIHCYFDPSEGEVIVVDNNSSDDSCEMVEKKFPTVKLIRCDQNFGFSKANNIGIAESVGQYLFLVNSDVEILGDCFSELLLIMSKESQIGLMGPRVLNGDKTLQRSWAVFPSLKRVILRTFALDSLYRAIIKKDGIKKNVKRGSCEEVEVLYGCFWLARRAAVDEVGVLDETYFMYAEDLDWCYRFKEKGWKVSYCPTSEIIHYGGVSSDKDPLKYAIIKRRSDMLFIEKHYSKLTLRFYVLMNMLGDCMRFAAYSLIAFFKKSKNYKYKCLRSRTLLLDIFQN